MRHNKKRGMKLGTDASHTKAMKKSLIRALFENDRIKTLDVRAKAIRPDVDKVITWAKKGDIASRRLAIAKVGDKELVREVFEKAAQGMWADRNGGYTRIMKLGPRKGDHGDRDRARHPQGRSQGQGHQGRGCSRRGAQGRGARCRGGSRRGDRREGRRVAPSS